MSAQYSFGFMNKLICTLKQVYCVLVVCIYYLVLFIFKLKLTLLLVQIASQLRACCKKVVVAVHSAENHASSLVLSFELVCVSQESNCHTTVKYFKLGTGSDLCFWTDVLKLYSFHS